MIDAVILIDDGEQIPDEAIFKYLSEYYHINSIDDMKGHKFTEHLKGSNIGCEDECRKNRQGQDEYITYSLKLNGAYYDSENEVIYSNYVKGITDMKVEDSAIYYCERCDSFGGYIYTTELEEDYEE